MYDGTHKTSQHRRLLPPIQPPQRLFRIDTLANAVHIEGVIPAVPGERTVTVCAEAAAIAVSSVRVDAQARMIVWVERAEIQSAPSSWPGSIEANEILYVVS